MPVPAALILLAGLAAAPAVAQPEPQPESPPPDRTPSRRPDAARRTVAAFDFEEYATNPELIPVGWRVGQDGQGRDRPGFPIFNAPELDYDTAFAGRGSVRLPTRGGSTSLIVESGVIPVFPDADYRVAAMVRTQGLRSARAFVEACLLDARGEVIEASRRRSAPVRTDGAWTEAGVTLWGEWPEAAFVRIELLVLQAEHFAAGSPGYQRVWPSDVSGAAWFDDVRVIQQPRITISTGGPGNIIARPQTPELRIFARDMAGESLRGVATIYDHAGNEVARTVKDIRTGRWQETWTPPLDRLGWYRAVVDVRSGEQRIGFGVLDFAWVPEPDFEPAGPGGLGAVLSGHAAGASAELAAAMQTSGFEHLSVPVWTPELTTAGMPALVANIGKLLSSLQSLRGRVALALPELPAELAGTLGLRPDQVSRALAGDAAAWGPYLDPLLDHYGQSVVRWQVGQIGDEAAMGSATLESEVVALEAGLSRLVPGPIVVVPWRADRQTPPPLETLADIEYSVLIPSATPPEGVEHAVAAWTQAIAAGSESAAEPMAASFVLEPFDLDTFGARAAVIDLVKRTVFAWAGSGAADPRLALADPWTGGEHARSPLMPRPEVAVWRSLRDRLRGRQVLGELPMAKGTRCFLLGPREGGTGLGALVAWNEWAPPTEARLDAMLTLGSVRVIDPFGNERTVEPEVEIRGELPARMHRIALSDMPVFIEGVDVALATLQASFRLEPGVVRAEAAPRDLELVLTNPWPTPISGRAFIVEPGGAVEDGTRDRSWRIEPRSMNFEAGPGQDARMPVSLLMREFEEAGPKRWIVDLRLAGREDLGWITVSAPLEVALEGIDLRISARIVGQDVQVEVLIANTRAEPVELDATVFAPDHPRERRSIGLVLPSTQVVRQFTYRGAAATLAGQSIMASVRESETGPRVNASVIVPR